MKAHYASKEEVENLREVRALKRLSSNQTIINLIEVLYDELTGRLGLVFELMEKNLYEAIKGRNKYLPEAKVKGWMYQVLKGLNFMHRNGIFHRDIKPENILLTGDNTIRIADLGSCKGIYSAKPFTEYISTRWYRAPECLLTDGYYNYKMDIWGVGCVFFEMLSLFPLFPGDDEIDQVAKIHNILGSPPKELFNSLLSLSSRTDIVYENKVGTGIAKYLTHVSPDCIDLISQMLIYDPEKRITAKQALNHPYFKDLLIKDNKKVQSLNESLSFMKLDDSGIMNNKKKKQNRNSSKNIILPKIKMYNYNIEEISENENSKDYNESRDKHFNLKSFVKLPRINFHYGKMKGSFGVSNEFSSSLKHNMSNSSIGEISAIKTIYLSKSLKKKPVVKKNYVSPYSKKNIDNIVNIL